MLCEMGRVCNGDGVFLYTPMLYFCLIVEGKKEYYEGYNQSKIQGNTENLNTKYLQ